MIIPSCPVLKNFLFRSGLYLSVLVSLKLGYLGVGRILFCHADCRAVGVTNPLYPFIHCSYNTHSCPCSHTSSFQWILHVLIVNAEAFFSKARISRKWISLFWQFFGCRTLIHITITILVCRTNLYTAKIRSNRMATK